MTIHIEVCTSGSVGQYKIISSGDSLVPNTGQSSTLVPQPIITNLIYRRIHVSQGLSVLIVMLIKVYVIPPVLIGIAYIVQWIDVSMYFSQPFGSASSD